MKLYEVNTPFETIKTVEYAKDGNTVVERKRQLRKLDGNFYCGEITDEEYSRSAKVYVYYPDLNIALYIGGSSDDNDTEYILEQCGKMNMATTAQLISTLDQIAANNGYIKMTYIRVANMIDPERTAAYMESRKIYGEEQAKRHKAEQERREAENQAYVNECNEEAEKSVAKAIEIIRNGGRLENCTVEFFRSRYDSSTYSIVNYLMRKYDIKTPIRTQGWINDRLISVSIKDGKAIGATYNKVKNGKGSQTFFEYMNELVAAVNAENAA